MALKAKLWTMALNAKLTNGFECQTDQWLLMLNSEEMVALNGKLQGNDEGKYAPVWRVVATLDPLKR